MLLPFGCCLRAEVVHCALDKPGFAAVTVRPIVHAVEHALQILAVEFVHVPGERRQAAVNGIIHLRVRFVLDSRECGSPRIGRVDRVLPARLRVNGRFVEDAMLGMGAPPNARNFCSFSSVRLWMASSVPFFSTGSFAENLTSSDASVLTPAIRCNILLIGGVPAPVPTCELAGSPVQNAGAPSFFMPQTS